MKSALAIQSIAVLSQERVLLKGQKTGEGNTSPPAPTRTEKQLHEVLTQSLLCLGGWMDSLSHEIQKPGSSFC